MPMRGPLAILLAIVLVVSACAGADTDATTPTITANPAEITFLLGIEDSAKRLLVRPGDTVIVRLPISGHGDPDWFVVTPPDPSVLSGGDNRRFYPSEPDQGDAYHEFTFTATGPGEAAIALFQGPITSEAPALIFTLEVLTP